MRPRALSNTPSLDDSMMTGTEATVAAADKWARYRPSWGTELIRNIGRVAAFVTVPGVGNVKTICGAKDCAEAVQLANGTPYGLASSIFTTDIGKAMRVAKAIQFGTVWINDYHPYVPQAEWGGMKRSGNGRELGVLLLVEQA